MKSRATWLIVFLCGCGAQDSSITESGNTEISGDVTKTGVAAHNQVVFARIDSSRFAALTFAYKRIDIIDWKQGTRRELMRPAGCSLRPGPISLVATDWSGDGVSDLLVYDTECGAWSARSEGDEFIVGAWPPSVDFRLFGPQAMGGMWGSSPTVLASQSSSINLFHYDEKSMTWTTKSWASNAGGGPEVVSSELYLRPYSLEHSFRDLLFQEYGSIVVLDSNLNFIDRRREVLTDEYVPKLAFDHFVEVPNLDECGAFASGVALYDVESVSRRSFLLQWVDGGYISHRLPFVHEVESQAVYVDGSGKAHLFAITEDSSQNTHLEVLRLDGCERFISLLDEVVDAKLTDAKAMIDGVEFIPLPSASARWMIEPHEGQAMMINYDGTDLRVFAVDLSTSKVELRKVLL